MRTWLFCPGAGHGIASILQMLLSCPGFISSDKSAEKDIRATIDFMLTLMQPNGNIAPAMDEVGPRGHRRPETEELVHWCHGAPGVTLVSVWLSSSMLRHIVKQLKDGSQSE